MLQRYLGALFDMQQRLAVVISQAVADEGHDNNGGGDSGGPLTADALRHIAGHFEHFDDLYAGWSSEYDDFLGRHLTPRERFERKAKASDGLPAPPNRERSPWMKNVLAGLPDDHGRCDVI